MLSKEQLQELADKGELIGGFDVSEDVYHTCVGLQRSALQLFKKDPAKYHYQYILGNRELEKTPAFVMGTMIHKALLEPEEFNKIYVSDGFAYMLGSRATNKYKNAVEEYQKEFPDRIIVKLDDYQTVMEIKNAVYKNPLAKQLLEANGKPEHTIFWKDPLHNILCKCRCDKFIPDFDFAGLGKKNIILEIKSTTDVFEFEKSIAKYNYYQQNAWYRAGAKCGLKVNNVQPVILAIDKEAPYHCRLGMIDPAGDGAGEIELNDMLEEFNIALKKEFKLEAKIEEFKTPDWVFRNLEYNEAKRNFVIEEQGQ